MRSKMRLLGAPAERAALSERALRRVSERFAWPAVAQATAEQYRQALAARGAAAQGATGQEQPPC